MSTNVVLTITTHKSPFRQEFLIFDCLYGHPHVSIEMTLAQTGRSPYRTTLIDAKNLVGISPEAWEVMSKAKPQERGGYFHWAHTGDLGYGYVFSWVGKPRVIFAHYEFLCTTGHGMHRDAYVEVPNDVPEGARRMIDQAGPHGLNRQSGMGLAQLVKSLQQQDPTIDPTRTESSPSAQLRQAGPNGGDFSQFLHQQIKFDPSDLN